MLLAKNYRIILASKSPRRSHLLREAGLPFIIKANDVEENYPADLPAEEVPVFLAKKKARAALGFLDKPNDIILAADSEVILGNRIFGKPQNAGAAREMLSALSGKTHRVVSGVCLLTKEKEIAFGDLTTVQFATLSEEEINYYIENFQPFDKAGAYAIQEWIGLCKIKKIEGTYANVMGLPVQGVWDALEEILG
jgi:septum formation protein